MTLTAPTLKEFYPKRVQLFHEAKNPLGLTSHPKRKTSRGTAFNAMFPAASLKEKSRKWEAAAAAWPRYRWKAEYQCLPMQKEVIRWM